MSSNAKKRKNNSGVPKKVKDYVQAVVRNANERKKYNIAWNAVGPTTTWTASHLTDMTRSDTVSGFEGNEVWLKSLFAQFYIVTATAQPFEIVRVSVCISKTALIASPTIGLPSALYGNWDTDYWIPIYDRYVTFGSGPVGYSGSSLYGNQVKSIRIKKKFKKHILVYPTGSSYATKGGLVLFYRGYNAGTSDMSGAAQVIFREK